MPTPVLAAAPPLPLTGERTVPHVSVENYWFQRHVAAYNLAAARVADNDVVDAGSGEGYGTAILARAARNVIGIEIVATVAEHARRTYRDQRFMAADVCDTGLPGGSVDTVVSLQVIEHLPDSSRFLTEARRILRPHGELIIATPNRLTFTPDSAEPANLFHVQEFTAAELVARLRTSAQFRVVRMLGLHHGPRLRRTERLTGCPFTDLVLTPPQEWQPWLHTMVRRLTPRDFYWSDRHIDTSLDLLTIAR